MAWFCRCFFIVLLAWHSGAAEAKKIADINVPSGWAADAWSSDKTNAFSHCAASSTYGNGTDLIVAVDAGYHWSVAFYKPSWRFKVGDTVRVSVKIDRSPWQAFEADVVDTSQLSIAMPPGSDQANLFRFGRTMKLFFAKGQFTYELSGTSQLLPALANCVERYKVTDVAVVEPSKKEVSAQPPPESAPTSSTGTGVIVASNGVILTNHHVVDGCKTIQYTTEGDLLHSAALLRMDATNDLAVLKSEQTFSPEQIASIRFQPPVRAGESIAVYGFPLAGVLSLSGNIVSGSISSLAGLSDDVRYFQISAPVQPGNSGGPLLDAGGNLIGIVNARISDKAIVDATGTVPQNINFSIKSSVVTSFLDTHSVAYKTIAESSKIDLPAIADKAKKFTVLISCER